MQATKDDLMLLWENYSKHKNDEDREQLILHYVPLVKNIVYKMIPSYSKYVESDDLLSYGIMGLIDAIDRFELNKGVLFESYAYRRIKGEIIDYLRRQDFISTSLRQKIKQVESAMQELEKEYGREASEAELCNYLNIDMKSLHKILEDSYTYNVVYIDEVLDSVITMPSKNESDLPDKSFEKKEVIEILKKCIDELGEQEKLVITLYYYEDLNIKEIGEVLGVTESRVSQIHSKALMKLRGKLNW